MNRAWLALFALVFLNQCGTQDLTGVTVTLSPTSPIVIVPDVTLQLGGGSSLPTPSPSSSATSVTVKGAWFKTDMTFTNSNASAVTFISIHYIVTGTAGGVEKITEGDLSASDLNVVLTTEIISIEPGSTSSSTPITLWIQNISKKYDNYNLSVSLKFVGYYSTPTAHRPLDRLEKTIYFNTR